MARGLILVLLLFAGGCAAGRNSVSQGVHQSEKTSFEDRAKSAHHRFDQFADGVGRALYPPLFVAAFPLWALSGFGSNGR